MNKCNHVWKCYAGVYNPYEDELIHEYYKCVKCGKEREQKVLP